MSFLKEPFFHFALLGAGIFAWFALANPDSGSEPDANEVVVSEQVFASLMAQFEAKLNRRPIPQEANALIDRYVRDEILVREALLLGLDQGDGIVRNRLVQKMVFLTTSAAQSAVPDEETLQKHLEDNPETFQRQAAASFDQVSLRQNLSQDEISSVLADLQAGQEPSVDYVSYFLPPTIEGAGESRIDSSFGKGFFAQLQDQPQGSWSGPVQSGYGLHLVRVNAIMAAELPMLDQVRDKVLADWRTSLAQQLTKAQEEAMMATYVVSRPSDSEIADWLAQ